MAVALLHQGCNRRQCHTICNCHPWRHLQARFYHRGQIPFPIPPMRTTRPSPQRCHADSLKSQGRSNSSRKKRGPSSQSCPLRGQMTPPQILRSLGLTKKGRRFNLRTFCGDGQTAILACQSSEVNSGLPNRPFGCVPPATFGRSICGDHKEDSV
jgi:hypothetical protein